MPPAASAAETSTTPGEAPTAPSDASTPSSDGSTAPPADPAPEQPRLTVAAVARRIGVAPATLRTWDRRYGLGPSEHSAGAHRRYSAADLARLDVMRRLTHDGVAPAEAARHALASGRPGPPPAVRRRPGGPGGRVLALPGADGTVRGLGRAAMALDARTITATIRSCLGEHGVLPTWELVLRPVLVAVGDRWAATGEGVEVEHLLSDCIAAVLREVASGAEEDGRRPVLLACAPDEQHALPLHALAAGLAERGTSSRTLGPAMPASALVAAVRRTGPALLFVWSQLDGTADPDVLAGLPTTRPPTAVVTGGPGWVPDRLPPRVGFAPDLATALDLVERALGPPAPVGL